MGIPKASVDWPGGVWAVAGRHRVWASSGGTGRPGVLVEAWWSQFPCGAWAALDHDIDFRTCLDNAVTDGSLRSDTDTAAESHRLTTALMGLFVLVRAQLDGATARDIVCATLNSLAWAPVRSNPPRPA